MSRINISRGDSIQSIESPPICWSTRSQQSVIVYVDHNCCNKQSLLASHLLILRCGCTYSESCTWYLYFFCTSHFIAVHWHISRSFHDRPQERPLECSLMSLDPWISSSYSILEIIVTTVFLFPFSSVVNVFQFFFSFTITKDTKMFWERPWN